MTVPHPTANCAACDTRIGRSLEQIQRAAYRIGFEDGRMMSPSLFWGAGLIGMLVGAVVVALVQGWTR